MRLIKAIIPLAGRGTRMRPHTHTKPKPLLPVAGKPVIDHVLERLAPLNITEYIFITGHLKDRLEEYIKEHHDIKARFIEQKEKDGTAGAVKIAQKHVDEPIIIVFGADTIFDADLSQAQTTSADGIIWAQEVEDPSRFGVIIHENGRMTKMVEKPEEPVSNLANIGLYYIKDYKKLFKGISHIYEHDIGKNNEYYLTDAFQYMIDNDANLQVAAVDEWYDTGKPDAALETNKRLLEKHHEIRSGPQESVIKDPVWISEDCVVENSIIGPNVSVARGCTIKDAILSDCIIDEGTTITNATLKESILGENTTLEGAHKERSASVMLGDHSTTKIN